MKIGPAKIANIISTDITLEALPVPIEDVIRDIINRHPEWEVVAEEKADLWSEEISKRLGHFSDALIRAGKQPRFSFNSVSDYMIQGSCFVEPRDPSEVKEQKLRRLSSMAYYGFLENLTPQNFEKACAGILGLLGVPEPVLTPYRGDQGIDFFGRMSFGDITWHGPFFPIFESGMIFWLVGQAKHYRDSKVSTPDLRELVGSVTLGRSRAFAKDSLLRSLNIRPCDPVIMLFFTTGEISADGWALCRKAGIAAMDGEMLSSFLSDKQVGFENTGTTTEVSEENFLNWVKGNQ
jgi:hypothetical protein